VSCFAAERVRCVTPACLAIVSFHYAKVGIQITPLHPKQPVKEMMQAKIMEDDNAGMKARYLPDRAVKQGIITDLIKIRVGAIQLNPRHSSELECPHLCLALLRLLPCALFRPKRYRAKSSQRRQDARCVVRDV